MKPSILVVQQIYEELEVFDVLESEGYLVTVCKNNFEAIKRVTCEQFSAVLLDCEYPNLGLTLLKIFREFHPHLPVLIMGSPSISDKREFLNLDISAFLPKPFTSGELRDALRRVMTHKRNDQE